MNNDNINIKRAVIVGLEVLNDPTVKIPSNYIEDLSVLKGILRSLNNGQLVLVPADNKVPEEPEQVEKN